MCTLGNRSSGQIPDFDEFAQYYIIVFNSLSHQLCSSFHHIWIEPNWISFWNCTKCPKSQVPFYKKHNLSVSCFGFVLLPWAQSAAVYSPDNIQHALSFSFHCRCHVKSFMFPTDRSWFVMLLKLKNILHRRNVPLWWVSN